MIAVGEHAPDFTLRDQDGEKVSLSDYKGKAFDQALARFAEAYADQNERDFQRVKESIAS
jgi:peroxiredoxin